VAPKEPAEEPPSMPRGRALDQGRRGWHRDARQRLDERRAREARPIPRSRQERLAESKRRREEELEAEREANEAYEAYRSRGIWRDGRRFGGGPPSAHQLAETPSGKINTTDPDSRLMKVTGGYVQGYNAQAAVSEEQLVLAAEISVDSPDFGQLEPMVDATVSELERTGIGEKPKVAVADAGYWHHEQMDSLAAGGIAVLIRPDAKKRKGARPGWQAAATSGCAGCSRPSSASGSTEDARRRSSQCSGTPSTTVGWAAFTDAAGPPRAPNGA
jgi:Transposase DDE domain